MRVLNIRHYILHSLRTEGPRCRDLPDFGLPDTDYVMPVGGSLVSPGGRSRRQGSLTFPWLLGTLIQINSSDRRYRVEFTSIRSRRFCRFGCTAGV